MLFDNMIGLLSVETCGSLGNNLVEWFIGMLLTNPDEKSQLLALEDRFAGGDGFAYRPGGRSRPDATCWAILALQAAGAAAALTDQARQLLVHAQHDDGRVCISPQHADACWPTALAALAWRRAPEYEAPRNKAIGFLLDLQQAPDEPDPNVTHDGSIRGWPWIAKTHAWTEPTAYALMALRICGYVAHERAQDAVRLLMDRQLPDGGWNYGNTFVFERPLRPMPETTGVSLQALAGLVSRVDVERSIAYLRSQLPDLNTPISLAWAVLGLHAWQESLDQPREQILHVLGRQEQLGPYDTVSLSLLLLAWHCNAGLVRFLEDNLRRDEE